eukprot:TRINITY_DN3479_c0_g2_i1.p1 TRINITY_DN3479_c0_g2~~TRINITY_DN3479_c0_g2_i1.p1  ORF type:complete len:492 (-),score=23.70 TRINITY_DN3479_c0_g2_i1:316-1791(-)
MSLQGWDRYERVVLKGQGAFGKVWLCIDRQVKGQVVAVKVIPVNKVNDNTIKEVRNQYLLSIHPHVIRFIETFISKEIFPEECQGEKDRVPQLCIVMEYAEAGSFHSVIASYFEKSRRVMSEDCARWCFQQHMLALFFCHRMQIVNRDIKPDNLLMMNHVDIDAFSVQECLNGNLNNAPILKLADFGYSKALDWDSNPCSVVGTPTHVAPEILWNMNRQGEERRFYDGYKADIWSSGVTLFELLTGTTPFSRLEDQNNPDRVKVILQRAQNLDYRFPVYSQVSHEARDLVAKLLKLNPNDRLTIEQIFEHVWFRRNFPLQDPTQWTQSYVDEAMKDTERKELELSQLERCVNRARNLQRIVQMKRFKVEKVTNAMGQEMLQWVALGDEEEEVGQSFQNGTINSSALIRDIERQMQRDSSLQGSTQNVQNMVEQQQQGEMRSIVQNLQMGTIQEGHEESALNQGESPYSSSNTGSGGVNLQSQRESQSQMQI